jgi:carboxypeptidase family protein
MRMRMRNRTGRALVRGDARGRLHAAPRAAVRALPARAAVRALALLLASLSLCLAPAAIAPSLASAAQPGSITGVVTAADTAAPLDGVRVCVYAIGASTPTACQLTGALGEYEASNLAPGQYEVEFSSPEEAGLNYLAQFYKAAAGRAQAEAVTVAEGGVTTGIDAALAPGGSIDGHVSDGEGAALAGVRVCALDPATGAPVRCVVTGESGDYAIVALATGGYQVEFSPPEGEPSYVRQFYEDAAARQFATAVPVEAGAAAAQANATLQLGAKISGTVSSAAGRTALGGVLVCAADASIGAELCASTASDGSYTIGPLPGGEYRVHFDPAAAGSAYAPQFYEAAGTEAEARPVVIEPGASVAGVDAVMQGVPVAVLKPAIVGRAVVGQTLSFLRGTWTNSPTSVTDEWGRCDGTGAIDSCHTVATTPTYTLTADDVGHTIRIREKASNEYGAGWPASLFSPATAIVAAAGSPVAEPTAHAGASASGVLPATARAATAAQLKALLASLLAPHGSNAKIGALLKHRGYTVSFGSLAAGRLSISWYLVPKGAHSRAKTLVARGVASTKASGASRLKIALTAAGRRLLRAATKVRLTAKGVLAASGRPSLSATRPFTLRR